MNKDFLKGTLSKALMAVAKLSVLLALATIGGAALVIFIPAYYIAFIKGTPEEALQLNFDEYGWFLSLVFIGIFSGTLGWGYLQALLGYNLVLRHIPNFWRALPLYSVFLFVGAFGVAIGIMHFSSGENPVLEALVLGTPMGFWGALFCVWRWHKRSSTRSIDEVSMPPRQ